MDMGHFIRHIFLVAGAVSSLSLFSCRKDTAPAELRREAGRIYLDFETTDAARVKANGDIRSLPEEKELRTLDIFIYAEGPDGAVDDNAAPAYYEHAGVGPDTDEIALKTPTASFRPNANYCVHVIANCDGESHKATVAFSDKTTRKELLAAAVNTPAIFSGNRSGSRDGAPFVMEAAVPGQRLNTADGQPVVVEAKLQRAAAKVVVRVKLDGKDDADGKRVDYYWAWQSGYQGSVYNAPTSVRIVAGNEFAKGSDQLDLETTGMIPSEEPEGWDSEKQYSASREPVEFVFYCYPNDWTQTYLPEEETFLNLRIPVVEATDGQVSVTDGLQEVKSDNYYKLQLNTESYKLERNHVYTIDATLRTLGAEAPEDSEPLEAEWRVAEWVAVDVNVEQDNIHFLELDHDQEEKIIVMANESDNQLVHYTSSHPIEEVTVSECYYTDGMGVDHPIEGGDDYPSVSYESGSLVNNLTVSSPIPKNNVPRYFTVTVRNSVGDERSFKVVQYPMEYITQTLSFWGAQQNRDLPGESYTYDKAPTRELKSGTGPGARGQAAPDRIAYKESGGGRRLYLLPDLSGEQPACH